MSKKDSISWAHGQRGTGAPHHSSTGVSAWECATTDCNPIEAVGMTQGCPLRGEGGTTEKNLHMDALCVMGKAWTRHKTTETALNNVLRMPEVGG